MSYTRDALLEAIQEARKRATERKKRNFIESIEILVGLRDVDLKKPENRFNVEVNLPNPIKKPVSICVIADGDLAVQAQNLGLHVVTKDDLSTFGNDPKAAKKLAKKFDYFVAMAPLMPLVGRFLGKALGPRGKMPRPIPPNAKLEPIIENYKKITRARLRNNQCINARIGTMDNTDDELAANASQFLTVITDKLPKGRVNLRHVHFKSTMGPAVRVT